MYDLLTTIQRHEECCCNKYHITRNSRTAYRTLVAYLDLAIRRNLIIEHRPDKDLMPYYTITEQGIRFVELIQWLRSELADVRAPEQDGVTSYTQTRYRSDY